ncbi:MAG: TetR/AcrR family transcriptional regulator [Paludibacter sp.]|nr:TetR/AcrR family transcriptional regulator [Paludibacter sp.]
MTKKQKIEHTAKELFWKHGFKKVSIDEICRKSHVSRKTFYTYFDNKSALVIFILTDMTNEMLSAYSELMESEIPFSAKIEKLIAQKLEMSKNFSMEFVADFFNPDAADILKYFTEITTESFRLTKIFFTRAQENGEMNPNLNIDFVMWMLQKQMDLTASPELMLMFPDAESMTHQISELFIYGIMPVRK